MLCTHLVHGRCICNSNSTASSLLLFDPLPPYLLVVEGFLSGLYIVTSLFWCLLPTSMSRPSLLRMVIHVVVSMRRNIIPKGLLCQPISAKIFDIFFLSLESDKIRYWSNFSYLYSFYTDGPNSPTRRSRTHNILFLFLSMNKWCLIV